MRLTGLHVIQLLSAQFALLFLAGAVYTPSEDSPEPPSRLRTKQSTVLSRSSQLFQAPPAGFSHFLGEDWIIDFHIFSTLLPLETAASTLQSFYEDTAYRAATTLSSQSWRYLIRHGQIDLEIRSQMGDIPWTFVIGFANAMLDLSKRGFTNTYQINYVNRITGKLLTISLWIGTVRWG